MEALTVVVDIYVVADGWSGVSGDDTINWKLVRPIWQESLAYTSSFAFCHPSRYCILYAHNYFIHTLAFNLF